MHAASNTESCTAQTNGSGVQICCSGRGSDHGNGDQARRQQRRCSDQTEGAAAAAAARKTSADVAADAAARTAETAATAATAAAAKATRQQRQQRHQSQQLLLWKTAGVQHHDNGQQNATHAPTEGTIRPLNRSTAVGAKPIKKPSGAQLGGLEKAGKMRTVQDIWSLLDSDRFRNRDSAP